MNPTVKKYLIIALKHAVNATLMSLYPVYQDPGTFNLHTSAGLLHILGIVGSAIAVKEGLVWVPRILKWSQTDVDIDSNGSAKSAGQGGFSRLGVLLLLVLLSLSALLACTNWERQTYQTLRASKSVIDTAATDYNAGAIVQTSTNKEAIEKARQVQSAAVVAFRDYWCLAHPAKALPAGVEVSAGPCTALDPNETVDELQQKTAIALAAIPEAVATIKALARSPGK